MTLRAARLLIGGLLLAATIPVRAGGPTPPHRQPQERRDANFVLLQFQNALAANRWGDALALCSAEVQAEANKWSSAEEFFKDTVPLEHVLSRDFNCWRCGGGFYGMFETVSDPGEQPRIDWYWGIAFAPDGRWLVDYPPVRLTEYGVQRKAVLQARDEKIAALNGSLALKSPFISTRIVPLTNRFVLGQPMCFRVELTNAGPTAVHYQDTGLRHYGLVVYDEDRGQVLTNTASPAQIGVRAFELPAHGAVTLAEGLDLTRNHQIREPGTYAVHFDGSTVQIGEMVVDQEWDRFGRTMSVSGFFGFFAATNKFPSNVVKLEVRR